MISRRELQRSFDILKKRLSDYEERPQQIEMAREVLSCLEHKDRLLIEAGTGVGKTFAYLVPAIILKEKTVISTASIALQDQLVNRDLVVLHDMLDQNFSFALLKGKNNYLCLKREKEFAAAGDEYELFGEWVSTTETGDKDELLFIPEFWYRVCGDSDDCSGKECLFYDDCFYYKHYRLIQNVDILVTNHHLLIYDLLSEGNLLPFHNQLIVDEAHQIENVISAVFGTVLSRSRILWLLYRLRGLKISVEHLFESVDSFFKGRSLAAGDKQQAVGTAPIPEPVTASLQELKGILALDKVISRLNAQKDTMALDQGLSEADFSPQDMLANTRDRFETTVLYVKSLKRDIDDFIEQGDGERVYYLGWNRGYMELRSNMVESGGPFTGILNTYESLVMTSATLTAGGSFGFLKERLGISGFRERIIDSPFDYKEQALLYIDRDLPSPDKGSNELFQQESVRIIEGLIRASRGRALVLFTSYQHLRFVARNIKTDFPMKQQGDMPPSRLISWFRETANPVLLATTTFWQGIDIRGEKLSLVVIVKMPFGSPGDPVFDERCRRLKERWFSDLALPSAILLLRQGFGRLIRGSDERGVVAILDSRLVRSSYGRAVIDSLPETRIVHDLSEVEKFFDADHSLQ